jgi:hypothetical protein
LLRYDDPSAEDGFLSRYETARVRSGSGDNFAKQNRFFTLFQMAQHVTAKHVPGDVAECGCWRGHSTYLVADVLQRAAWSGRFLVFDSFEGGLSGKTAKDRIGRGDTDPAETSRQERHFASSFDQVSSLMAPFPFVSLHKGWIPEVFGTIAGERAFSLVHIDVDLYEPTRDSLSFFLPRMAKGGVIVVDDYGGSGFPGATIAVDEAVTQRPDISLFIKGHLGGCVIAA